MEDKKKEATAEWYDIATPEQYGFVCSACGYRTWNRQDVCPKCGKKMVYHGNEQK